MKNILGLTLLIISLGWPISSMAEDNARPVYVYFGLHPDIITNYVNDSDKIGFINVSVELMLASNENLAIIEKHEPLIRDKIISILGKESPQRLRTLTGREEVRKIALNEINILLKQESGVAAVENLLFTKYLMM